MNYSQIINDKMNSDLKNRYSAILAQEYNIVRQPIARIIKLEEPAPKQTSTKAYIAVAMVLLFAIGGMLFTQSSSVEDPKEMIHQYMASNDLSDIATTRNMDAATTISNNPEALFFEGMSLLENEKYAEATEAFKACADKTKEGEAFYHETKVYLIISHVMNNENNLAKTLFNKLPKNSWERLQLQEIIQNIG